MSTASTNKTVAMIVQSLPPLPSGGAEIQSLLLAKHLGRHCNIIFITPGQGKIKGHEQINGIHVYRLHSVLNYLIDFLLSVKSVKKIKPVIEFDDRSSSHNTIARKIGAGARLRYNIFLINAWFFLRKRKNDIDILHSHTIEWPGYVAAILSKSFKKKLVVKDSTMNGIENILRFPSGKKKRNLIIDQAHFVAMTNCIKNNLIAAGVKACNISDIPNGIEISSEQKTNYAFTGKVLFVGNLYQQPAKGIDILLKAWHLVTEKNPSLHLMVAGDGDLDAYRKYAQEKNTGQKITFLGKHNNIGQLMLESDVFVLPSRREGMPNVLMEAMLRALPCVATDISGSQDLIMNGINGLLVPPAEINALADGINYMLANRQKAEEMGRLARETIIQHYDMNSIAEKYLALYEKL